MWHAITQPTRYVVGIGQWERIFAGGHAAYATFTDCCGDRYRFRLVCVFVSLCVSVYRHACACYACIVCSAYVYAIIFMCVCPVHMCGCMAVYVCMYVFMCSCTCMVVCMYACMYACMHACTYVCMYMHVGVQYLTFKLHFEHATVRTVAVPVIYGVMLIYVCCSITPDELIPVLFTLVARAGCLVFFDVRGLIPFSGTCSLY
jgi:hypothetical protein